MASNGFSLPHLFPTATSIPKPFRYPTDFGSKFKLPVVDRIEHGMRLLDELSLINVQSGEDGALQTYIQVTSAPNYPLNVESLEADGRTLHLVRKDDDVIRAVLSVNEKSSQKLSNKINDYLTKVTSSGKPKNQKLVESIDSISEVVSIRGLWTDERPFPDGDILWEVWIPAGSSELERKLIVETLEKEVQSHGLEIKPGKLEFPESTVVMVKCSPLQLNRLNSSLHIISELRRAASNTDFFLSLKPNDQHEWADDFLARISLAEGDLPAVCLLDTGVQNEHPLLTPSLPESDMDTYNVAWGLSDIYGHGTQLAGLSLFGDMAEPLSSAEPFELRHKLESVKIMPEPGYNEVESYSLIMKECAARAELLGTRNRVFCMAATDPSFRDFGRPSAWSASIDSISSAAFGAGMPPRLFFVAAGNADQNAYHNYPGVNRSDSIHDPGQAWNSLTVGAFTEKFEVLPDDSGKKALASRGTMSPHTTTSCIWDRQWPNKPDIVMEGGNLAYGAHTYPEEHRSLRLTTTNHKWRQNLFLDTGATSAATALAARIGGMLLAEYPNLWPETIRALIVHSASWTDEMLKESGDNRNQLLRCYGYGVPDLQRALRSADNVATLVIEDSLQPYALKDGKTKSNEMNFHRLPWPTDILTSLGLVHLRMKVTLSYFIEPNPSNKGYKNRHKYASHSLRFATKLPAESEDDFQKRVNRAMREADENVERAKDPNWYLDDLYRNRGSIHSDVWTGTAAELATKAQIGIYPVGGWWKDLKTKERYNSRCRYSLIISIEGPEEATEIYGAIENLISIPIPIN